MWAVLSHTCHVCCWMNTVLLYNCMLCDIIHYNIFRGCRRCVGVGVRMCMYVCVCVCVHACVRVCVRACWNTCLHNGQNNRYVMNFNYNTIIGDVRSYLKFQKNCTFSDKQANTKATRLIPALCKCVLCLTSVSFCNCSHALHEMDHKLEHSHLVASSKEHYLVL